MPLLRVLSLLIFSMCIAAVGPAHAGISSAASGTSDRGTDNRAEPGQAVLYGPPEPPQEQKKSGVLEWLWKSVTDEANITASVGLLQVAMTVKRSSDGATATLVQRDENAYFLSYGSKPTFFEDSNFGYTVMVNYVHFTMTRQEVASHTYADLNTEVNGQMIYAVPTLYYQWGEHHYDGTFIRLGAGVGLGAATYSGTVRFTSSASPGETVRTSNWSYAPRLATSSFLEARWKHFGIAASYASPRIYGDDYDIRISDFSVRLGYTYYF